MPEDVDSLFVRYRKLRGITQQQLADALGVTVHTVSNWEVGRTEPKLSPRQYRILLNQLRIRPEQLPDYFGPQPTSGTNSKLKELREKAGLSYEELARQLTFGSEGVTEDDIRFWEEGAPQPLLSIPQTAALCQALDIDFEQLQQIFAAD